MTIEEKKKCIMNYCDQHNRCVVDQEYPCPLFGISGCECFPKDETKLNENFKLVSAMPDYKGQKETEPEVTIKNNTKPTVENVDNVNRPAHYTQGGMECIDEMLLIFGKEAVKHFCICNAWKYRKRAMFKNGQEDMDKSDWYINKFKELNDLGETINI